MGDRMPLTRQMVREDGLEDGTVLFDVQVASDLIYGKPFKINELGPVRAPYPQMFFEWEWDDNSPLPQAEIDRMVLKYGVGIDGWQQPIMSRAGCRVVSPIKDRMLIVPSILCDDGTTILEPGVALDILLDDKGRLESCSPVDLMEGERVFKPGFKGSYEDVLAELEPMAFSGAQVALTAISLINCKNVTTEKLGSIKMRRSGRQKRQGIKPVEVRYNTIVLPGGGSRKVGTGSSTHHQATALHRVRGHFKTYTSEAPLMGKHTGTYWWGWQVRGDLKKGAVVSDYELGEELQK